MVRRRIELYVWRDVLGVFDLSVELLEHRVHVDRLFAEHHAFQRHRIEAGADVPASWPADAKIGVASRSVASTRPIANLFMIFLLKEDCFYPAHGRF